MKPTKKQIAVGGTLALLMSPVMLVGAVARFVCHYVKAGWVLTEMGMEELQKKMES